MGTDCKGTEDAGDEEIEIPEAMRLKLCVRTVLCSHAHTPLRYLDQAATRFKCGVSKAQDEGMSTWVPRNFMAVLLLGTPSGENLVIVCNTGVAYAMSPALDVPSLPADAILVANCTLDHDETFRVLIYDGENLPQAGPDAESSTPGSAERYRRLLHFFPRFFHRCETAKSTFVLQWVGYYNSARKFLSGQIPVGHRIGGLLTTTDDAMRPTRPMRVQIPVNEIKEFRDQP
jgi:hypothetical protein